MDGQVTQEKAEKQLRSGWVPGAKAEMETETQALGVSWSQGGAQLRERDKQPQRARCSELRGCWQGP